jgi:glycosyltransferase involved in cell wall biosynthesis
MTKLTVVIPCSRTDSLVQSVESVYKQCDQVIIVDDGTADKDVLVDCLRFINGYVGSSARLLVNKHQEGFATCMNRAVVATDAEYIALQRDCDVSRPDRMQRQMEYLEQHPEVVLLGSHAVTVDAHGMHLGHITYPPKTSSDMFSCVLQSKQEPVLEPTIMFRRAAVESLGGFSSLHLLSTFDLVCRMLVAGMTVENLQQTLVFMRIPRLSKYERLDRESDADDIVAQFVSRSYKRTSLSKKQFEQDCFTEVEYNITRD